MIQLKRNKSHHFYIECKNDSCRYNAMVPLSASLKEYGEDITSDEVLRRARCTKCGFQGNNQMRLVYVDKSSLTYPVKFERVVGDERSDTRNL